MDIQITTQRQFREKIQKNANEIKVLEGELIVLESTKSQK